MIKIILILCIVLIVIIGYKKPQMALSPILALLLLIPSVVKIQIGINMNVFNLAVFSLFLLSIKLILKSEIKPKKLKTLLVCYSLYVAITTLLAQIGTIPLGEYIMNILKFLIGNILLAYTLLYVRIDKKCIKYIDVTLIIATSIIIVYGLLNYITKFNPYMLYLSTVMDLEIDLSNSFMEEQRGLLDGRISSTFIHPLQLGQASLLIFSYSIFQFRNKINVVVYYFILLGLLGMCVLSGSRSSIFPIFIVILLFFHSLNAKKKMRIVVFCLLSIPLLYVQLSDDAKNFINANVLVWDQKASEKADIKGSSIDGRMGQFVYACKIIKDDIFLGKGYGYVENYGDKHKAEMVGYESFILVELINGGGLGLIVFVLFYYYSYRVLFKHCSTRYEQNRVRALCFSFFVSAFLTGISYTFFSLYMLFYFMTYYNLDRVGFVSEGYLKSK